jgi:uncharacterized membrane protein YfcA
MGQAHLQDIMLVGGVFFAAGLVKGTLGMGLPTLAMGLLGLAMPVAQAAALITLPSLVTNVWQACAGRALRVLLARLWSMLAGIAAGVAIAAWLPWHEPGFARLLLGACLLAYGVSGWAGWRLPAVPERWQHATGAVAGALTGVVTGVTGVFVLPAVPYLQSLQLDRHALPQALALAFTTATLALAALLAVRGDLGVAASLGSALALVPALLGMFVGQKLRDGMSEAAFRRCFFGGLVLLGAWLTAG